MDLPIACTLTGNEFRGRERELAAIGARALRRREPVAGGERLTFAAGEQTERELRAMIAAEAECCAFLRMDLVSDGDELVLEIAGPEDARPLIAGMFACDR